MSRAYRIRLRESAREVVRVEDEVTVGLELLPILDRAEMATLLGDVLESHRFAVERGRAVRREPDGVEIEVALDSAAVTLRAQAESEIHEEVSRQVRSTDLDARERLRDQVERQLADRAELRRAALEQGVAERLEARLAELRPELDGAADRVTAEALKKRARQLGTVESIAELPNGDLTITVKVEVDA